MLQNHPTQSNAVGPGFLDGKNVSYGNQVPNKTEKVSVRHGTLSGSGHAPFDAATSPNVCLKVW